MTQTLPVLSCDGCGVCCMHMAVPPYTADERELLKANRPHVYADLVAVEATREVQLTFTGAVEVPCGFFDMVTRKCRHHEDSPGICSRFEIGGEFCVVIRERAGI
jgi:Fe-S-cluster containining protein